MEPEQPTTEEPEIAPCEHMTDNISALSDNSLRGPLRWYTQLHASYCPRCGPALRGLRRLHERLEALRAPVPGPIGAALSDERRTALERALDTVDNSTS